MPKKLIACLVFLMMMLASTYGAAQTLKISRVFAPRKYMGSEGDLDQACGSLAISGGAGWLVYEITASPYRKGSLHAASGQYLIGGLFVDSSPYFYPDIVLKDEFWPQLTSEPKSAVDGQPQRWHMKAKIGRNLKPFNLKVCWSAPGVRIGGGDYFMQFGQTVDISVTWTPEGEKEPGNIRDLPSRQQLPEGLVWEAEGLNPIYSNGCSGLVQQMEGWGNGWSKDAQLFGIVSRGGTVTLPFSVDEALTGELSIYMTVAPDYAIVSFLLDGEPVGDTLDTYAPEVAPSGRISLGLVTLAQGIHRLTVKAVGWNPKKEGDKESARLGIDCISLKY